MGLFIGLLHEELKRAEEGLAKQLKIALAALETRRGERARGARRRSLLNQLRRDTQQARTELLQAINPAWEGSPWRPSKPRSARSANS